MNEQIVTFGDARPLVGVLHRPERARRDVPAVLLLNAGILHRVGPNRLYVSLARDLARRGFHVLRFDVWGIGDSQEHGASARDQTFFDDTLQAMEMVRQTVGTNRFLLMGICMGAKIALEVARRDARVESLVCMEGIYIKSPRYYLTRLFDPVKWKRLATGESHLVKKIRGRLTRRSAESTAPAIPNPPAATRTAAPLLLDTDSEKDMKGSLRSILARGTNVILVFRDGNEIAYNYRLRRSGDRIEALGLPRGLTVELVRFADHTFTPVISQELLRDITMRWIDRTHPAQEESPLAIAM